MKNLNKIEGNIKASFGVLDAVIGKVGSLEKYHACINVFDNCREQGFCIKKLNDGEHIKPSFTTAFFSEHRSTDMIVVYIDKEIDFRDLDSNNLPVTWEYVFFSEGEFEKAADYIIDTLGLN